MMNTYSKSCTELAALLTEGMVGLSLGVDGCWEQEPSPHVGVVRLSASQNLRTRIPQDRPPAAQAVEHAECTCGSYFRASETMKDRVGSPNDSGKAERCGIAGRRPKLKVTLIYSIF